MISTSSASLARAMSILPQEDFFAKGASLDLWKILLAIFTSSLHERNINNNKLGLNWSKLSSNLELGFTLIKICCITLMIAN